MDITLRQIEIFLVVARELNYSRASEILHLTQSGITRQMQTLEKACGYQLIQRIENHFLLTKEGSLFKQKATAVVNAMDTLKFNGLRMKDEMVGKISLSIIPTMRQPIMDMLKAFTDRYPNVNFHIAIKSNLVQRYLLRANKYDLFVMSKPPEDANYLKTKLIETKVIVAMSKLNPLAKKKKLKLKDLKDETFIIAENTTVNYTETMDAFNKLNCHPNQLLYLSTPGAIQNAISANLGVSLVVEQMFCTKRKDTDVVMKEVDEIDKSYGIYLVHQKSKGFTPALDYFKEYLIKHLKK